MKKKIIALILVLLMIPAAAALAAQGDWAELRMKDTYAVIGGSQSMTIRSHTEHSGRGGYAQAVYAYDLTGNESQTELASIATQLIKSGTKPVWGGSKHCFHGGAYTADPVYTMKASDYAPGSYLYVCYAFVCQGSSHNHYLVNCYDRISAMSLRVTKEAQGLELQYILKDKNGKKIASLKDGGEAELDLRDGKASLELSSAVKYPTERVVGIRADFDKNQAVEPFSLEDDGSVELVCCGSGSITVTIGNYLNDTTRTETIFIEVPCVPMEEPTVTVEPTCTEEGLAVYLCRGHGINCETTFDELVIDPTGHTLREVEEYILEPTATLPGLGLGTCRVCGMEGAEQTLMPIFSDVVSGSFYSEPLDYCYAQGWVTGVTADTFVPGNACVRAQVVTFLWRAAGKPEPTQAENPFVDVKKGDFYYDAVLWALENGITTGTDASHFSPLGACNRAQVVTFLWRAFDQPEPEAAAQPFADVQVGSWYEKPVLWAVEEGITSGMSATSFGPTAACNRAQIVTFLFRAYAA